MTKASSECGVYPRGCGGAVDQEVFVDVGTLRAYINRVIAMKDIINVLNGNISKLYKEAASDGFDKDALKETVKISMEKDADKREKRRETIDLLSIYLETLGLS